MQLGYRVAIHQILQETVGERAWYDRGSKSLVSSHWKYFRHYKAGELIILMLVFKQMSFPFFIFEYIGT